MATHSRFAAILLLNVEFVILSASSNAQQITTADKPAQLDIRVAGANSIRITLKPLSFKNDFPYTPAVAENKYSAPVISLHHLDKVVTKKVGKFEVTVKPNPLTLIISNSK